MSHEEASVRLPQNFWGAGPGTLQVRRTVSAARRRGGGRLVSRAGVEATRDRGAMGSGVSIPAKYKVEEIGMSESNLRALASSCS